jgi:hypothetical protein
MAAGNIAANSGLIPIKKAFNSSKFAMNSTEPSGFVWTRVPSWARKINNMQA